MAVRHRDRDLTMCVLGSLGAMGKINLGGDFHNSFSVVHIMFAWRIDPVCATPLKNEPNSLICFERKGKGASQHFE